jgi:hypothetical protein
MARQPELPSPVAQLQLATDAAAGPPPGRRALTDALSPAAVARAAQTDDADPVSRWLDRHIADLRRQAGPGGLRRSDVVAAVAAAMPGPHDDALIDAWAAARGVVLADDTPPPAGRPPRGPLDDVQAVLTRMGGGWHVAIGDDGQVTIGRSQIAWQVRGRRLRAGGTVSATAADLELTTGAGAVTVGVGRDGPRVAASIEGRRGGAGVSLDGDGVSGDVHIGNARLHVAAGHDGAWSLDLTIGDAEPLRWVEEVEALLHADLAALAELADDGDTEGEPAAEVLLAGIRDELVSVVTALRRASGAGHHGAHLGASGDRGGFMVGVSAEMSW